MECLWKLLAIQNVGTRTCKPESRSSKWWLIKLSGFWHEILGRAAGHKKYTKESECFTSIGILCQHCVATFYHKYLYAFFTRAQYFEKFLTIRVSFASSWDMLI